MCERPGKTLLTATGCIAIAMCGVTVYGYGRNPVDGRIDPGRCASPFAETDIYQDSKSSWLSLYTATGQGVVVRGQIPAEGSRGIRAGYRHPASEQWSVSGVIPTDREGNFTVKFAIGKDPVVFGVQALAAESTPGAASICDQSPIIVEDHVTADFPSQEGIHPWPNPANIYVHTIN